LTHPAQEYDIPDPALTELGQQQCRKLEQHLRQHLPLADKVERIITSPMLRTLETTTLGLDWLIKRGVPVEASALWQENSDKPCDTGSPLSDMEPLFPNFDFSKVDPLWPSKTGPYAFTRTATIARGQTCLRDLQSRKEKVIAVVSHSGFLRCAISLCKYANADYRIFSFEDTEQGEDLELKEWKETEENGGGLGESEKGRADIEDTDFPEEQAEEVEQQLGGKTNSEAAREVPEEK
ncbi:phosphoglycerate mutase-like protein, partial [Aureobasidium melanogenum]